MIISKTPYRISFFGGGTDFPYWYKEHGGAVLSTTIDKYCYISCRKLPPFFAHKHRFVYSIIEDVVALSDVKHPAIRGILQWLDIQEGLEIHHDGDLPARSGLGSSSSFTVGLLHVLSAYRNNYYSKEDLARDAIHCEQNVIGEVVGSQDQISAAYGGLNRIEFNQDGIFSVSPLIIPASRKSQLEKNLLLFFTGKTRLASSVAKQKVANFANKKSQLFEMRSMVAEGINILTDRSLPLSDFGHLLHQAWLHKRDLANGVTNSEIDSIYEAGRAAGAIGGKLLGAGGGGFILFYVEEDQHQSVINAMAPLVYVPFKFESEGSSIAVYQPETD